LLADALEELLDSGGVTDEGGGHLETTWWDITDSSLDVVRDPFNEVGAVLVLNVEHLLVNFLHGHAATEDSSNGEVATVTWITSSHHVLSIEHLLSKLWNSEGTVLLGTTAGERSKARNEEVKTWEWNHVDSELAKISVELTWEAKASGDTAHACGDEMVKITVSWSGELEGTEADIVESLVIDAVSLIGVLNELMDRESGVVWFDNGVGNLRRWDNGKGVHDTVWVFLTNL
jgi:hypothetical protein